MPSIILPNLDSYKLTLEPTKWYILTDPTPRLVLALGQHTAMPKSKGGYWIYDPKYARFETILDTPQIAWEVEVEIKGL